MKKSPVESWLFGCAMLIAAMVNAQNRNDAALYTAFDNRIQIRNAAFNNGKVHFNPYRSADRTFRYYNSPDFMRGAVVFDGQWYGNLFLKYDLLADELVVKFDGEGNKMGFSPVKERIAAFDIDGIKFANLDLAEHPDYISGFYEETKAGEVSLYTKHRKNQITSLSDKEVLYTYVTQYDFFLSHGKAFYKIDGKRDVIAAFPTLEVAITNFFDANVTLEKTDRRQFMKRLAFELGKLLNFSAK